jgi:hypothetical protein
LKKSAKPTDEALGGYHASKYDTGGGNHIQIRNLVMPMCIRPS